MVWCVSEYGLGAVFCAQGRGTQVVRERSGKPLCVGSIPTRASIQIPSKDAIFRGWRFVLCSICACNHSGEVRPDATCRTNPLCPPHETCKHAVMNSPSDATAVTTSSGVLWVRFARLAAYLGVHVCRGAPTLGLVSTQGEA